MLPPPTASDDALADPAVQVADQLGVGLGQLAERAVQEGDAGDVGRAADCVSSAGSKPSWVSSDSSASTQLRLRVRRPASLAPRRARSRSASAAVGTDALGQRGEQAGEQRVRGGSKPRPGAPAASEVDVLRPADGAAVHGLDVDEAGLAQALEVQAHGVGVQAEAVGELLGASRPRSSRASSSIHRRSASRRRAP